MNWQVGAVLANRTASAASSVKFGKFGGTFAISD
jgi:hypothetical protein